MHSHINEDDRVSRDDSKVKRVLYLLIVLAIMTKKYIEETLLSHLENEPEENLWVDIEQALFNLANNMINTRPKSIQPVNNPNVQYSPTQINIFYHCAHLILQLCNQTKDLDNYVNVEKFIGKSKLCIEILNQNKSFTELPIFKYNSVIILGSVFEKTNNHILDKNSHSFLISLYFSLILSYKDFIQSQCEPIKTYFKNNKFYLNRDAKSEILLSEDSTILSLFTDKNFSQVKEIIDSFYKYITTYTTDVNAGKKIWKLVEEYVQNQIDNSTISNLILEITIIYIFNKSRTLSSNKEKNIKDFLGKNSFILNNNLQQSQVKNNKILLSSIFEFLCDKFSFIYVKIPLSAQNYNMGNNNNLNLFYEVICNHYDIILTDQILNERYMQYFARIFMEDALAEVLDNAQDNEDRLLIRLYDILNQSIDPLKLLVSLISNISKFFYNQVNMKYESEEQVKINMKFLEKIYKKLNIFFTKFSNFHSKREKHALERDEVFSVLNNFSISIKLLRTNYIMLFIKFFSFVELNFKLDLEFTHRKKIYVMIFEMFFEIISTYSMYENNHLSNDEFLKLIELVLIVMKNYSKASLEDGYLIYKMTGIVIKKLLQFYKNKDQHLRLNTETGVMLVQHQNSNFNNTQNMNEINSKTQNQFLNIYQGSNSLSGTNNALTSVQITLVYGMVNMVMFIISAFYQLSKIPPILEQSHSEMMSMVIDQDLRFNLDELFRKIDILNIVETVNEFNRKINSSNFGSKEYELDFSLKFLEGIHSRLLDRITVINVYLEELMNSKGLQV
jgi:hypothetical protein